MHWIWIFVAFMTGGFLGFMAAAMFASNHIAELKHWNRRLYSERNEARRQRDEAAKINKNLMEVEQ